MGLGALTGLLGNKKEGGQDTGNLFRNNASSAQDTRNLQEIANGGIKTAADNSKYYNPESATQVATGQVQSNPMLSGVFGQGGTMDRTNKEEQDLASRGFSLKPEDYEAYGQASGDIARQFGQSDQSMAQALSDRGLSNSGAAGAAFTGSQGNKMEQLAGIQRKIANDRMNMNMQRLGQTRNFLSGLNQQAGNEIGNQFGRNIQGNQQFLNNSAAAQGMLGNMQGQDNEALGQRQQTSHQTGASAALNGEMNSLYQAGGMAAGMSGGGSGMGGGQKKMGSRDEIA